MEKAELALEDRVYRALGTLTHARILTSEEAATCLSNVRLGVDLQMIDGIQATTLNECVVCMQPCFYSTMQVRYCHLLNEIVYERKCFARHYLKNMRISL